MPAERGLGELNIPSVGSTPAAPASGVLLYTKPDGKIYKLTTAGVESEVGAAGGTPQYFYDGTNYQLASRGFFGPVDPTTKGFTGTAGDGWAPIPDAADMASSYAVGKSSIYVPPGSLDNWKAARNNHASQLVPVVGWGDSIMWGAYSSNILNKGWFGKLGTDLRSTYSDGGSGFFSAGQLPLAGFASNGSLVGSWTFDQTAAGPGEADIFSNSAALHTWTIPNIKGSTIDIWWLRGSGFGTISWDLNGGAQTGSFSTNGTAAVQSTTINVTGGGTGPHTLVLTGQVSATVLIYGVTGRNPTGIIFHNMAQGGRTSAAGETSQAGSGTAGKNSITDFSPRLFMLGIGVNDIAAATSVANFTKGLANRLSDAKAYSNGICDCIIIADHMGTINADTNRLYPQYVAAMADLARSYNAVFINRWSWGRNSWDYWNSLGYWGTAGATGAQGTDVVHPGDTGHAAIEAHILPILTAA